MAALGTGATISFGTTGFSASMESFDFSGIKREAIPTSHLGTAAVSTLQLANATFMPGTLIDGGEVTMNIQWDPDSEPPMLSSSTEQITFTWPMPANKSVAATWVFDGFGTGITPAVQLDQKMMATLTLKIAGVITRTQSS